MIAAGAKLDETDGVQVENTAAFSSRMLTVLKEKKHPETRLSNEELQVCNSVTRSAFTILLYHV